MATEEARSRCRHQLRTLLARRHFAWFLAVTVLTIGWAALRFGSKWKSALSVKTRYLILCTSIYLMLAAYFFPDVGIEDTVASAVASLCTLGEQPPAREQQKR
jgi:hypothetical protein